MNKEQTLQYIRELFFDFFKEKNHTKLDSYPLIPEKDPTLLFVNSGMAPLKEYFLGISNPIAKSVVTCQKCLRVGGKHNDLEQIGYTKRHHTFFEMLGNFSFGAYFKKEAIEYAWEFITKRLKLDVNKLYATVHPTDQEAYDIWLRFLPEDKITKLESNFWFMGDEGPCGPCTEIFYDLGEHLEGCQPGKGEEGDRFLEIWNLVFMMYEQSADGNKVELPQKCVDTGAGLERLAAVLNQTDDTFNIPDMQNLIKYIEKVTKKSVQPAHKVLADHARSVAFLFADGIMPGADGRSYILRKLIRRAARFGYKLDYPTILEDLLPMVVESMKEAYPELDKSKDFALKVLTEENERFLKVLEGGMLKIDEYIRQNHKKFSGEFAFMLYDTYGFPIEILNDIARENNMEVELEDFNKKIQEQRERSKKAWQGTGDIRANIDVSAFEPTLFLGYQYDVCNATVIALFPENNLDKLETNQEGFLLLDQTVFYGESGGQVNDLGAITGENLKIAVLDVQIMPNKTYLHKIKVEHGTLFLNAKVKCEIDTIRRNKLRKYHTATHLLHAALREVLGDHIVQKGSLVDENKLRFDFAHGKALTSEEIMKVEQKINYWIGLNLPVSTSLDTPKAAIEKGAMALFGEKYPEKVRVVSVGDGKDVSIELCGGTHVSSTGLINYLQITHQSACGAGIRRVQALCGTDLVEYLLKYKNSFDQVCNLLKTDDKNVMTKVEQLLVNKNTDHKIDLKVYDSANVKKAVVITDATLKDLSEIFKQSTKQNKDVNAWLLIANNEGKNSFMLCLDSKGKEVFGSANEYIKKIDYVKGGGQADSVQGQIKDNFVDIFIADFVGK